MCRCAFSAPSRRAVPRDRFHGKAETLTRAADNAIADFTGPVFTLILPLIFPLDLSITLPITPA
jgi:hypothetical protein